MHSIIDYALSLHFFPLGASVVLPGIAWLYGWGWLNCTALCVSSLLVSAAAFLCQPLMTFAPLGGHYNVGLQELRGDLGAMKPPISVFYPTVAAASAHGVDYIPFNDTQYVRMLTRFAGVPYFMGKGLLFNRARARLEAPIVPLFQDNGEARPIVLFSHGLVGYARLYSTLLMDMAARGVIVFAVTHMDASAAYCRDAGVSIRIPLNLNIAWKTKDREPQLDIRVRETRNTIQRIRSGELLLELGYAKEVVNRYCALDAPIHLVGHSFGGATVLAASLEEEKAAKENNMTSPIASVVAYDPWAVPLREKLFYQKLTDKQNPYHFATPALQLFSEEWIRDKAQYDFFVDVEKVVKSQELTSEEAAVVDAANRKLKSVNTTWYTRSDLRGTGHHTYTDVSLFSPVVYRKNFLTVPSRAAIMGVAHQTVQFIHAVSSSIPIGRGMVNSSILAAVAQE